MKYEWTWIICWCHSTRQQRATCVMGCAAAFYLLYYAVSFQSHESVLLPQSADHPHRQLHQQSFSHPSSNSTTQTKAANQAKTGDPSLSGCQKAVRVGFYRWLSLLNLLATSTLWARAANAFDSNAAARLFGFLGAGATLGILKIQAARILHGNGFANLASQQLLCSVAVLSVLHSLLPSSMSCLLKAVYKMHMRQRNCVCRAFFV